MYCFRIFLKFFTSVFSKQLIVLYYWLDYDGLLDFRFFILPRLCVKWFTEAMGHVIIGYSETSRVEFLCFLIIKVLFRLFNVRLRLFAWNLSLKFSTIKSFLSFSCTKFSIRHSMSFFIILFWDLRCASTLKYFLFLCNIFYNMFGQPNPMLVVWHLVL